MKDSLNLSPTPIGEDCAQLGAPDYYSVAKKEIIVFISQLIREHGEPPRGARYRITNNPHDFGTYYDLNIEFDDENDEASEYAYKVEGDLPEYWDEIAIKELDK